MDFKWRKIEDEKTRLAIDMRMALDSPQSRCKSPSHVLVILLLKMMCSKELNLMWNLDRMELVLSVKIVQLWGKGFKKWMTSVSPASINRMFL